MRRTWDIMLPRQIGYYLCKHLTPLSLPAIGRRFGGRDHTTALSGIRKIERLLPSDEGLRAQIAALTSILGSAG
jgi:chromosomal replication initiator protein